MHPGVRSIDRRNTASEVGPAGVIDPGVRVPGDLPGESVGIGEVRTDPAPGWRGRFTENASPRFPDPLKDCRDVRLLTDVLGECEGDATVIGIQARRERGILGERISLEEGEHLPRHVEEGDVVVAARMFLETDGRIKEPARGQIADSEGDEGDVVTESDRRIRAHEGTMTVGTPRRKSIDHAMS